MKISLYYPIPKPAVVNQMFGQDPTYYAKFGYKGHNGVDFRAPHGTPVRAAHDGIAQYQKDDHGGDGFVIRTQQTFDFMGGQSWFATIYWHLCSKDDQQYKPLLPCDGTWTKVKAGQLIGYADNTGAPYESTGDHLHFGLKPLTADGVPSQPLNGYGGSISPTPFFNGLYGEDIATTPENAPEPATVLNSIPPKLESNPSKSQILDWLNKLIAWLKSLVIK